MRSHVFALIVAAWFPASLAARDWTDVSGEFHREAEFLKQVDGQVWLEDAAGKQYVIRADRLSASDREYVASLASTNTAAKPRLEIATLAYRKPAIQAARTAAPLPSPTAADASLMRLTGWHCYSGYCCPTIHCCPTPCPVHPCPPPPDKGKRIMRGWHSTFHLVARLPNKPAGTGSYKFVQRDGCCHHYLSLLNYVNSGVPNEWIYDVVDPIPGLNVTQWRFIRVGSPQEWYWVYYKSPVSPAWVPYDIACGKIVE